MCKVKQKGQYSNQFLCFSRNVGQVGGQHLDLPIHIQRVRFLSAFQNISLSLFTSSTPSTHQHIATLVAITSHCRRRLPLQYIIKVTQLQLIFPTPSSSSRGETVRTVYEICRVEIGQRWLGPSKENLLRKITQGGGQTRRIFYGRIPEEPFKENPLRRNTQGREVAEENPLRRTT